jgi:hypothetical protein
LTVRQAHMKVAAVAKADGRVARRAGLVSEVMMVG